MGGTQLAIFALALALGAGSPGPSVAALVSRVLTRGLRDVLPFLAALWLGEVVWLTLVVAGCPPSRRASASPSRRSDMPAWPTCSCWPGACGTRRRRRPWRPVRAAPGRRASRGGCSAPGCSCRSATRRTWSSTSRCCRPSSTSAASAAGLGRARRHHAGRAGRGGPRLGRRRRGRAPLARRRTPDAGRQPRRRVDDGGRRRGRGGAVMRAPDPRPVRGPSASQP